MFFFFFFLLELKKGSALLQWLYLTYLKDISHIIQDKVNILKIDLCVNIHSIYFNGLLVAFYFQFAKYKEYR